ncbi:ABC transporter ATP-binding protein [Parenemella sanctibonifatiensis]|uniref:Cobalt ABC transporter ATP-binding protein n=1 Tax=Parenemella sanctibonifatiensis TaxID=2016505 RepID=A0A255E063_9ACTN|nr:ABC transporter ATP-binding protein [Parenemella sanctibonifatiensis]OYN84720.1 cobalt ABC transporter ATP-binding protein [Parenemella sanctibonifatiensis]
MISCSSLSVRYGADAPWIVRDADLSVAEGDFALLVGRTGSGKSTLLGSLNNLVPRFTGGTREGRVVIDGQDVTLLPPRDLAHLVGWVGQDPMAGFVTSSVEEELAFAMEQLGYAPDRMRTQVELVLDLLGIAHLRRRNLRTLSGGEQQRVAIGSVLTAQPRVLVLDEPTSALDPVAAEEVLAVLQRLVEDQGTTVVIAEHRLERVVAQVDEVIRIVDGYVSQGDPAEMLVDGPVPPIVELGRELEWQPLPLSIRAARRRAAGVREELSLRKGTNPDRWAPPPPARPELLTARGVTVRYGARVAVSDVDLGVGEGEVVALMGRNGSGKSSLLWALHGAGPRHAGTVRIAEVGGAKERRVALVPQNPTDLLYLESVSAECAEADARAQAMPGTTADMLSDLVGEVDLDRHPRDLSEGQRLALVLALQLVTGSRVILLDEPTRGLDYEAKAALGAVVADLARGGRCVVIATHDVEFVARSCERVLVMAEGDLVADGPTRAVLTRSPYLAPQVSRIMAPVPALTTEDVTQALAGEPSE